MVKEIGFRLPKSKLYVEVNIIHWSYGYILSFPKQKLSTCLLIFSFTRVGKSRTVQVHTVPTYFQSIRYFSDMVSGIYFTMNISFSSAVSNKADSEVQTGIFQCSHHTQQCCIITSRLVTSTFLTIISFLISAVLNRQRFTIFLLGWLETFSLYLAYDHYLLI